MTMINTTEPKARLGEIYKKEIVPKILKEKNYSNVHQVPKITKIVLTTCLGKVFRDKKTFDGVRNDFEMVGLQKSVVLKAKKSIASFNLRAGMDLGYKITLRREKMYYFLDRLVNMLLVLDREFRGFKVSAISGNKKGGFNFSCGIKDISEFPEVEKTRLTGFVGMGVTICTNSTNLNDCKYLLEKFNFPFIKEA